MRLCMFRQSEEVLVGELAAVCSSVGAVLGVAPIVVEEPLREADPSRLLDVSASFLEHGQAIVALVLTAGACESGVLGEGVQQSRGAWVKFSPDRTRTVLVALHEIGHLCEAEHCNDKTCLMFPYYVPRAIDGQDLAGLLCPSCRAVVMESWNYCRLRKAEVGDKRSGHAGEPPRAAPVAAGVRAVPEGRPGKAFPDWSLPREEFVRQVKQFFGYH